MLRIVKEAMEGLLYSRKLPLVLDLDDTLVRLVGEGNDRHVPESDVHRCKFIKSIHTYRYIMIFAVIFFSVSADHMIDLFFFFLEFNIDGNRVVSLSDSRRVVLTERVHEFLDWAQNFYEISVCSLG